MPTNHTIQAHLKAVYKTQPFPIWLLSLTLLAVLFPLVAESQTSAKEYRIGTGDRIHIQVYEEKDLSLDFRVDNTGRISYPFLGELQISGQTPTALAKKITAGLKGPYLIDPKVTVAISEYRLFYVNGEVKNPGGYPFQPGLTVRKAISLAGGLKERASQRKISVVHEQDSHKKPSRIRLDDRIRPGDIITIEQSFF